MPEIAEVRIMSDYINHHSSGEVFNAAYHVEKGNIPVKFHMSKFRVSSTSSGKELVVNINDIPIYCFMGMSGNWKYVRTNEWNDTKYTRLRLDNNKGYSLLMHGGYMGPKYSVGKRFVGGIKRGPDPVKEFEIFKINILDNLQHKDFDKPICETLLNQKYFNGIGNYMRSTILYYMDIDPFLESRQTINENINILDMCRDTAIRAYKLNGGHLKDWRNPFDSDYQEFRDWVFYQKGTSCKDSIGRTFWFDKKWKDSCPYGTKDS